MLGRATFPIGVLLFIGAGCGRDPRSFDAAELTPLLTGTAIIEGPFEGCPNGAEPIGDCDAVARVTDLETTPALTVISENAVDAGFVESGSSDTWLFTARQGERCLFVSESAHVDPEPGELQVFLGWC
jgi:hypothetical protein